WPEQHLALMAILDAKHFLAVIVVAAAFAPQIRRLDGRHQQLDGAGAVLFFANNAADFVQYTQSEWQKGINARRLLPDHAGPQHEPMRYDLGLFRGFTQD